MNDPDVPTGALVMVERLAGAIRYTLGEEIDAYPGSRSPEGADPFNRAFAAIVRTILVAVTRDTAVSAPVVSVTLRLATEHRLAAEGWSDAQVRTLIEHREARFGALGAIGFGVGFHPFQLAAEEASFCIGLIDPKLGHLG